LTAASVEGDRRCRLQWSTSFQMREWLENSTPSFVAGGGVVASLLDFFLIQEYSVCMMSSQRQEQMERVIAVLLADGGRVRFCCLAEMQVGLSVVRAIYLLNSWGVGHRTIFFEYSVCVQAFSKDGRGRGSIEFVCKKVVK